MKISKGLASMRCNTTEEELEGKKTPEVTQDKEEINDQSKRS